MWCSIPYGQDHPQAGYLPLVELPGQCKTGPCSRTVDWLLSQFGKQRAAVQRKYRAFVAEGIGQTSPWEKLQGQVLPGGPGFVERVKPGLRARRPIKEISRTQRFIARPALVKLFRSGALADLFRRNEVIRRAYLEHGYSLSEIGRAVGLHYSTISRIVNQDTGKPNGRHEI